jgi:hypothetical protein
MNPELIAAYAALAGAVLVFIGGLVGTLVTSRHNRLENQNEIQSMQLKMIDQLQEERNHTEELLTQERQRRRNDIAAINQRFEKYREVVQGEKNADRIHIKNLTNHIIAGEPPPPPEPPPGFKP